MSIRTILLLLLVPRLFFGQINQVKLPIDLNTVFITIDVDSYNKLFENTFVKDTLFLCRNNSTSTEKESYSGKYLLGKSATIEFFAPMNTTMTGDTFGDVGIEFKTRKINQLSFFTDHSTKTETTFFQTDSLKIPWYRELTLDLPSPHLAVSLLEYQKEYLNYMGLSDEEINIEMTYDKYNSILSGNKKYPRKFNSISAIELEIESREADYLIKSIQKLGGTIVGNELELNGVSIKYSLCKEEHFRVKKIIVNLTEEVQSRTIIISKNIKIKTKEKCAEIQFSY